MKLNPHARALIDMLKDAADSAFGSIRTHLMGNNQDPQTRHNQMIDREMDLARRTRDANSKLETKRKAWAANSKLIRMCESWRNQEGIVEPVTFRKARTKARRRIERNDGYQDYINRTKIRGA